MKDQEIKKLVNKKILLQVYLILMVIIISAYLDNSKMNKISERVYDGQIVFNNSYWECLEYEKIDIVGCNVTYFTGVQYNVSKNIIIEIPCDEYVNENIMTKKVILEVNGDCKVMGLRK